MHSGRWRVTQNAGKLYLELRQYSGGLIYHCRVKVCSEGNQASAAHNLRARAAVVRVLRGRRQGETHPEQDQDPMEDGASRSTDSANRSAIEDAPRDGYREEISCRNSSCDCRRSRSPKRSSRTRSPLSGYDISVSPKYGREPGGGEVGSDMGKALPEIKALCVK